MGIEVNINSRRDRGSFRRRWRTQLYYPGICGVRSKQLKRLVVRSISTGLRPVSLGEIHRDPQIVALPDKGQIANCQGTNYVISGRCGVMNQL